MMNEIDKYITAFPEEVQQLLQQVRATIRKAAPEAEEIMSYKMPAYRQGTILVYFAGYKNHIGFYPTSSGIEAFKEEFLKYRGGKGSVQFPLDKPIPLELIARVVAFRANENLNVR